MQNESRMFYAAYAILNPCRSVVIRRHVATLVYKPLKTRSFRARFNRVDFALS